MKRVTLCSIEFLLFMRANISVRLIQNIECFTKECTSPEFCFWCIFLKKLSKNLDAYVLRVIGKEMDMKDVKILLDDEDGRAAIEEDDTVSQNSSIIVYNDR